MRTIHHWLHAVYGIPDHFVLNRGEVAATTSDSPAMAADLRRLINAMKVEAFDLDRGGIDYGRPRISPTYVDYRRCARQLQVFDLGGLSSREEQYVENNSRRRHLRRLVLFDRPSLEPDLS